MKYVVLQKVNTVTNTVYAIATSIFKFLIIRFLYDLDPAVTISLALH